jgi:hypothetical protein
MSEPCYPSERTDIGQDNKLFSLHIPSARWPSAIDREFVEFPDFVLRTERKLCISLVFSSNRLFFIRIHALWFHRSWRVGSFNAPSENDCNELKAKQLDLI